MEGDLQNCLDLLKAVAAGFVTALFVAAGALAMGVTARAALKPPVIRETFQTLPCHAPRSGTDVGCLETMSLNPTERSTCA
jgi:hypothetical protein